MYTKEQQDAIRQYQQAEKQRKRSNNMQAGFCTLILCVILFWGHYMMDFETEEFKPITYLPTAVEEFITDVEGN